jgi:multidrug efflux pump subunit AcrB
VIHVRGIVGAMNTSMRSCGVGHLRSLVLVYRIRVAHLRSFVDPLLILLAVPPGIAGVIVILVATGTTLNIMSLMGLVMMVGIVVSNSILIVEFTHRLLADGTPLRDAVQYAVRVRLRPILMTSLATVIGLIPMALALEAGSESYAPLARAIIGGLLASVVLTVFIVPSAVLVVYRRRYPDQEGTGYPGTAPGR